MKLTRTLVAVTALSLVWLSSCKKPPHEPPAEEVTTCKITSMAFKTPIVQTADFSYNSKGNPTSVVVSTPHTGNPHLYFLYDQYNRVTDCIGSYTQLADPLRSQFTFEYWIRFVYADVNPNSLPVTDTVRAIGGYNNGVYLGFSSIYLNKYTYDSQNRIAKVDATTLTGTPVSSLTYNYDGNGNLVIPGVTYDTKKNYRQTNKVWMLIDRNYSKNNPFTATVYTSEGYPMTIPAPGSSSSYTDSFLKRAIVISTLNYSCSTSVGAP